MTSPYLNNPTRTLEQAIRDIAKAEQEERAIWVDKNLTWDDIRRQVMRQGYNRNGTNS